jgi:hypothetical protein
MNRVIPSVFQGEEPLLDLEVYFRKTLLAAGNQVFVQLLQRRVDQIDAAYQPRAEQIRMGRRPLRTATLFGPVQIQRDYYYDGQKGHCPADAALGFEGSCTPALARLICRSAAQQAYGAASRDLQEYGGVEVDERQIQRTVLRIGPDTQGWLHKQPASKQAVPVMYLGCDGTGAPMRREELVGRKGKGPDGQAKTREVKLGAVFTQHVRDEKGRPIRDHASTTYLASFESVEQFAPQLRQEAIRRGVGQAEQVVFLSDGAAWTEELQRQNFPNAVSILDFYHAAERVHALAKATVGAQDRAAKQQASRWIKQLLRDQVDRVIGEARAAMPEQGQNRQLAREQIDFLSGHKSRMRYGTYRRKGWFIGSGVVEAGCKTVIGKRLKQSGMFWTETGASCVLNFRTLLLSSRFDGFWRDRQNDLAARNDPLPLS